MAVSPKTTRIPFYKLVASSVDLASAFKIAVDAFNAQDLTTLMTLCDNNVVVVGVHQQDPHCGKEAVAAFFTAQFQINKPRFTPTSTSTTINPDGTVGHIIGTADWTSYDPDNPQGAHLDGTICYAFNFVSRGNGWLISTLWGFADHLNPRP